MSGFSSDWLALREPADRAARQAVLARAEIPFALGDTVAIVDLACGTGASFRCLAPHLAADQQWLCIDHDPALLARFGESLRSAASTQPEVPTSEGALIHVRANGWRAAVELRCADLGRGSGNLRLAPGTLLGASALLDLVSADWLTSIVAACADAKANVHFALTYDGRIDCAPGDPFDGPLRALINRHQRRDKGFGPALGPAATAVASDLLERAGFRVATAPSDWHLGARDAPLQRALIEGWIDAAREVEDGPALERWRARRLAEAGSGRLAITVGHLDLFAAPAG